MNILLVNSTQSFKTAVSSSLKGAKPKILTSAGIENALVDIQKHTIHVAIINWSDGDFDIEALCRRIRKIKSNKVIYLLVVAPRDREQALEKILLAGANDFIFKPFGKGELQSRIRIAERIIKLEEEILRNKKRMLTLVKEDPITGLMNRRCLLDDILSEMGRASRESVYISSLMVGIVNFKELTEIHGMKIMEEVLAECGRRIKTSCRPYDKLGRYTVSEFLLFLPGSGKMNTAKVAKRIVGSLVAKPFYVREIGIQLSLAIGIAELDPKQISKNNTVDSHLLNDLVLDSIIKKTEIAVKQAMRSGVNRIEIFTE